MRLNEGRVSAVMEARVALGGRVVLVVMVTELFCGDSVVAFSSSRSSALSACPFPSSTLASSSSFGGVGNSDIASGFEVGKVTSSCFGNGFLSHPASEVCTMAY